MRLIPVAKQVQELLGIDVRRLDDCVGEEVNQSVENTSEKVFLLENLRFYKEETENDPDFARQLATLADVCEYRR